MKIFMCICLTLLASTAARSQGNAARSIAIADSLYSRGAWSMAIPNYERALKDDGHNAIAWNRLGYCHHNLNNFAGALMSYEKALGSTPNPQVEYIVLSRMARIAALDKRKEDAFRLLDQAISKGYALVDELKTHGDFAGIRGDARFDVMLRRATEKAFPCLADPHLREFDFWLGTWDVFANGTTQQVGESQIDLSSGGCMILENWTARGPVAHNGKSMNYVNPETSKWEQLWIGSGGINRNNPQKFVNGEYRDHAMRFEFSQTDPQGNVQTGRFIFFNEGPDQVRQFNEVSSDGGKTWTTVYDFVYKRRKQ